MLRKFNWKRYTYCLWNN